MLTSLLRSLIESARTGRHRRATGNHGATRPGTQFAEALAQLVAEKIRIIEEDNFDRDRYVKGPDPDLRETKYCEVTVADLLQNAEKFGAVHDLLADRASRDWFTKLVAYRLLGRRHIRLPSNTPAHWETRAKVKAMSSKPVEGAFGALSDFHIDFDGERIGLRAWWSNIAWTFFFRQYFLSRGAVSVAPQTGDHVVDAGACFGDTALAFAAAVGPRGRVVSFEIVPSNMAVARENAERNPVLHRRIRLYECALAHADVPLYLHGTGPGAQVTSTPSEHRLAVTTIDRLVESGELERVDFIKMDIEGAERYALQGAERSIRRFRPKLAISVYHQPDDLWRIAHWVDSLGLGYRLYLDHYTIHHEETVLYAVVV